jgi:hypothetical protein
VDHGRNATAGQPALAEDVRELILRTYVAHDDTRRPHRGLDLRTPDPRSYPAGEPFDRVRVRGRGVLGGLIHGYELAA